MKENINDADDVSEHYIDLEDPNYRLGFEPSQRHVGFVKMRCKDDPSKYNRTPQTPNSVLSPSSASVASEVEMPESVVVDPDNFVMNRFIESTSAEHRKSFDESHPRNLPHLHQKPSAELRRSSSFKDQIISETDDDDDDDDTGADFMKKLGEKVNSQQAQTMLHSQYQFAPVREGVRPASTRAMSPPPAPATSSSLTVPGERDQRRSSRASSRGSLGTMGSGSEFGYAVTKPRSLASEYESARHSLIPNDCFHSKHVPLEDEEDMSDDDDEDRATMEQRYLSSSQFLRHFERQFPGILADLGKRHLTSGAKSLAPSIICNEEPESSFNEGVAKEQRWYFTPTISVPFNNFEATFEFPMR